MGMSEKVNLSAFPTKGLPQWTKHNIMGLETPELILRFESGRNRTGNNSHIDPGFTTPLDNRWEIRRRRIPRILFVGLNFCSQCQGKTQYVSMLEDKYLYHKVSANTKEKQRN
ncbi:hypothetical protein C0J52_25889 [Blattella germanica]|nr:hypothetical protein C0J52_25889 [Blattella germanica]